MDDKVPMVPGFAVNAALGRAAVDPDRSYPITWRELSPPAFTLLRCQVMDKYNGNACHLPLFPIAFVWSLPTADRLLGGFESWD